MKTGQVVFNEWHGIRRYGVVTKTYVKGNQGIPVPWTYAEVKWFNDEAYERTVEFTDNLRNREGENKTIRLDEYRADQLKQIDLDSEIQTLTDIKIFQESLKRS